MTPSDTGPELSHRFLPDLTDFNRGFWTSGSDGVLRVRRCTACGTWQHPPRVMCPQCRSRQLDWAGTAGVGSVYSYTVNWRPWNPVVPVPYVIALVELDEQAGLRLTTNLVNCDLSSLAIGLRVEVVFEAHGEIYVPLFQPLI
ncbi:MAG: OB-fold domain-containing protein [Actinomycetota bacterium]|nr:OB-fold domain-containing protein [Actinomycetota bacterium]